MSNERRRHQRVKLNLLVQFRLQSYDQFLADYASDVSLSGMFLRTKEPKPEGTLLYFQFTTKDDGSLIEGLGRVVRVVERDDGEDAPAGMGIEFVNVEEPSMACIRDIVERRAAKANA